MFNLLHEEQLFGYSTYGSEETKSYTTLLLESKLLAYVTFGSNFKRRIELFDGKHKQKGFY